LSALALLAVAGMSRATVESGREVLWDFTQADKVVKGWGAWVNRCGGRAGYRRHFRLVCVIATTEESGGIN